MGAVAVRLALLAALAVILWGASVGAFHIFRNIGLSPDAFTVAAGGALIALSGAATIALPVDGGLARGFSALLAAAASLVTVYSVARWATRRWYITVARRVNRAAETRLRALVLWTRRQHGLFGWVILATATAHAVYFLPHLAQAPTLRVVTGVCAWILLTCLIAIGMYISRRAKAGRPVRGMRPVHVGLAVAFVVALLVHV